MGNFKTIKEHPPKELSNLFNRIQAFPTETLAKQLWNLEENLLRKENVWKDNFSVLYGSFPNLYAIEYYKRGLLIDNISSYHWDLLKSKFENVTLSRVKGKYALSKKDKNLIEILKDIIYGRIGLISTTTDAKNFNEIRFD